MLLRSDNRAAADRSFVALLALEHQ
jgi:hypothetical protein